MGNDVFHGSCLCGTVAYEILPPLGTFQYCHCSRCRKKSGSAHASNIFVKPGQFRWTRGEDRVTRFEMPEAEHYASMFCSVCGSSLPWLTKSGAIVVVPAGSLDDDPGVRPTRNIFRASGARWHEAVDSLPSFDELPKK